MISNYPKGISVVICCHNSLKRIGKTLEALSKQQCGVSWEIIIIDNASDDDKADFAIDISNSYQTKAAIRSVYEPVLGLGYARKTGIKEASFSIILFCDDDNWLREDYIQGMFDILEGDESLAACGGSGIPLFETKEPYWFYEYAEAFALGSQEINAENGELLNLYGAGLAVKKNIVETLYKSEFKSVLKDRVGKTLTSAGDTELTYALVLMGYKLKCSNELRFFHFLSKERLEFSYLKKLFTSFGNDGPVRNLYYSYLSKRFFHRFIKNWSLHFTLSFLRLIKYFIVPPKKYGRSIFLSWNLAYIKSLLALRREYSDLKINITNVTKITKITHTQKRIINESSSVKSLKNTALHEKVLHQ